MMASGKRRETSVETTDDFWAVEKALKTTVEPKNR